MIRFETLERLGVAVAAISDRSDADCGTRSPGVEAALRARRQVCTECGVDCADLVCVPQVHGTRVARVREVHRGCGARAERTPFPGADGMVTDVPGLPLAVFVADCVPIFLVDVRRRAAALIHAGREGTFRNISAAAAALLERELAGHVSDMHAVLGPSAGPCCYEVSAEIAGAFATAGLPSRGRNLDLWEANAGQLHAAGIPRSQIAIAGICTICDGRFHSHRRDADGARNMALLML